MQAAEEAGQPAELAQVRREVLEVEPAQDGDDLVGDRRKGEDEHHVRQLAESLRPPVAYTPRPLARVEAGLALAHLRVAPLAKPALRGPWDLELPARARSAQQRRAEELVDCALLEHALQVPHQVALARR